MSACQLVKHVRISPNKSSPRNRAIDTITIHCMAGNCAIETCGEIFAPASRQASSNYGIGSDGRIGMYVEEKDRSWCTSSGENDNRTVTIEVANDGGAPDWHVSDKALAALIDLCADICERNGIKRLLWKGDKSLIGQIDKQNMTVHRWFADKSCPGDYLYGKHTYIADEVNKRLGSAADIVPTPAPAKSTAPYLVKITADFLNYRSGAGVNFPVKGVVRKGAVYTIVGEADGAGAKKWGRLKSGSGWISLDYTRKI